ncbi:hypothetical protein CAPTEDRAFT_210967 [Capitella teleta]|uniref:Endonuclease/exonuclease/phosphatase domain-containing protein n=1 Tax=Capitella teleta TaxID=283909 RepID=R7TIE9_CAPTE|nr:hypothetical protein CAPTEDRAFT_210967 [Capitella teleta]|eukprot:ELT90850.1 hypothetical protein CAPTEDRAFT_210967 [Capitella teleta]
MTLNEIRTFHEKISSLRAELAAANAATNAAVKELRSNSILSDPPNTITSPPPSFTDVVCDTVKAAIKEESHKTELILSKVEEKDNDTQFLSDLCDTMQFYPIPKSFERIGRKRDDRQRLLKVSFDTQFNARSFKARCDVIRKENHAVADIRVIPSLSKEECVASRKSRKMAYTMNQAAKKDGDTYSFSVNLEMCERLEGTRTNTDRSTDIGKLLKHARIMKHHRNMSSLSIICLNPWSVCNKTTTIRDFIIDEKPDLLCLSETWLTGMASDNPIISAMLPDGYDIQHQLRASWGGGLAIIHRMCLPVQSAKDTFQPHSYEVLKCTVKAAQTFHICVVYHLPKNNSCTFLDELADHFELLAAETQPLLTIGVVL